MIRERMILPLHRQRLNQSSWQAEDSRAGAAKLSPTCYSLYVLSVAVLELVRERESDVRTF